MFPGKARVCKGASHPSPPPPKITARLHPHPVQRDPLQQGLHTASLAAQALLALTSYFPHSSFSLLFQLRFAISILHSPYSQLRLCLPVREMPSLQLKPVLVSLPLAPASLKPRYPQVCCRTAANRSSSKAPRLSITWCYYHSSACPGNISVQAALRAIWETQLLPTSCYFSALLPSFAGVRNVALGINLAPCLHFHPWP